MRSVREAVVFVLGDGFGHERIAVFVVGERILLRNNKSAVQTVPL